MITENQITIGVELEMVICGFPEYAPEFQHFRLVNKALKPVAERAGTDVIETVTSIDPGMRTEDSSRVESFIVQEDPSIKPLLFARGRGVEVATPILRNGQWRTIIPDMCQALKRSCPLGFNNTTGLHVHIGIGQAYTLQDFRRISKAVVLFESRMDKLHPECRSAITVDGPRSYNYIKSNRFNRVLANLSDCECMNLLDDAVDITGILKVINCNNFGGCNRSYKYNLTSINEYGTAEFRQAIGMDDEDKIVAWIGTVIQFVTSAISTSDEMFNTWATDGVNDPDVYRRFGVPV